MYFIKALLLSMIFKALIESFKINIKNNRLIYRLNSSENDKSAIIKDFFTQGNVENILGHSFERDVSQLFIECGFKSLFFEQVDKVDLYSFDIIRKNEMLGKNGNLIGQIDLVLNGDKDSFENLKNSCPEHYIFENFSSFHSDRVENEGVHILLVEAKLTSAKLVKAISQKSSPSNWWIENDNRHKNIFKAFIMNGGEESISFIKKTSIKKGSDEEKAWQFIEKNGISIFYFPSFSLEWLRDLQIQNKEIKQENKDIKLENKDIKLENKELKMEINAIKDFIGFKKITE